MKSHEQNPPSRCSSRPALGHDADGVDAGILGRFGDDHSDGHGIFFEHAVPEDSDLSPAFGVLENHQQNAGGSFFLALSHERFTQSVDTSFHIVHIISFRMYPA